MKKVFVTGHNGMVGSAFVRGLNKDKYQVVTADRKEWDLLNFGNTKYLLSILKPDVMIMCAARVGGIRANLVHSAEYIYENLAINTNCIEAARQAGVKRVIFMGSSCIYPKNTSQPIKESQLLTGLLEPSNEPYAIAKIAGLKMIEAYKKQYGLNYHSIMPCNLYGPNDNYDYNDAHVLPALIHKIHLAKTNGDTEILLWGNGEPLREFLFVDDLVDAVQTVLDTDDVAPTIMNVGSGTDLTIRTLAEKIKKVVGWYGRTIFENTKGMNGTMRKLIDSSRIRQYDWFPKTKLDEGIKLAYNDYLKRYESHKTDSIRAS
jgi:GDP-L-fucose synthase